MGRAREIADLIGGTTPDIILKTSDGAILNLQTSDTTVTADSVLGAINFQAPDEASGTDSILIGSKIEAIAEGTFAADNNATKLVFSTGASEAAASKMTLSSGGVLDVDGGITVDNITIDGTEIDLSSGDLTIDVEGDITLDANGQQIFFAKGGTTFGQFGTESTPSTFTIESTVSDGDINFKGNDGGSGITAMTIDMSAGGRVGIGTTSPATILDVDGGANSDQATFSGTAGRGLKISTFSVGAADEGVDFDAQASGTTQAISFSTGGTERARFDGSGNFLIGETSQINGGFLNLATSGASNALSFLVRSTDNGHQPQIIMQKSSTNSGNFAATADNESLGQIIFRGVNTSASSDIAAFIEVVQDGTSSSTVPAEMRFGTEEAEAMRIHAGGGNPGSVTIGKEGDNATDAGVALSRGGCAITRDNGTIISFNRLTSDGDLINLMQNNATEGKISVLGSTVSFEGFSGLHESSGVATDTPIGTVVSTIDELDVYSAKQEGYNGEEDNPKAGQTRADHAKIKVSDTVGDSTVYGVVSKFNAQDKVFVASVGIGSVRVTGACAKGDLLESNGDGTAKVQSDDIVRSKTLGKVTIGNSNTGVKLVSCVLYCG